jgi:hypothetical protein
MPPLLRKARLPRPQVSCSRDDWFAAARSRRLTDCCAGWSPMQPRTFVYRLPARDCSNGAGATRRRRFMWSRQPNRECPMKQTASNHGLSGCDERSTSARARACCFPDERRPSRSPLRATPLSPAQSRRQIARSPEVRGLGQTGRCSRLGCSVPTLPPVPGRTRFPLRP